MSTASYIGLTAERTEPDCLPVAPPLGRIADRAAALRHNAGPIPNPARRALAEPDTATA